MNRFFLRLLVAVQQPRDTERGATAIEYGLIAALIAATIIGIVTEVGQKVVTSFTNAIAF